MTQRSRNRLFLGVSGLLILFALIVGFWRLGAPSRQREFAGDTKRIEDFSGIARAINATQSVPPAQRTPMAASLFEVQRMGSGIEIRDPLTSRPYEYRITGDRLYELCAVFTADSRDSVDSQSASNESSFWNHPRGRYCFRFNAAKQVPVTP